MGILVRYVPNVGAHCGTSEMRQHSKEREKGKRKEKEKPPSFGGYGSTCGGF